MLKFWRKKPAAADSDQSTKEVPSANPPPSVPDVVSSQEGKSKTGLFSKLQAGLRRTRQHLTEGIAHVVLGKKKIDAASLEEIETQLLLSDLGIEATDRIIADLTKRLTRQQLSDGPALFKALHEDLIQMLAPHEQSLELNPDGLNVILMVGINGAGKTTTIGKLAKRLQRAEHRVMLAAGDTFRAAAVEQLQVWGERNDIPVIAQPEGNDSASVIFDAMQAAQAKKMDVLIADTAGRLHTQTNLMAELKKVIRVIKKLDPNAPHEIMLVLDAGIGQNALNQARQFHAEVGVTGLAITKLDGTAKGGIIFAIAHALSLPIRYIGIGEGIDDLRPFSAEDFVDALLSLDQSNETLESESED